MTKEESQLAVARSLYAQMCHFHDETEEQRQRSAETTKKTAGLVKMIGTLLVVFVVVTGVYIRSLVDQFVVILNSMEKMNEKVVVISEQMHTMKGNMVTMNASVNLMEDVKDNMKKINYQVHDMQTHMNNITENVVKFNGLGGRALGTMQSMNEKMTRINQSTSHMNVKMYEIARPAKVFPN